MPAKGVLGPTCQASRSVSKSREKNPWRSWRAWRPWRLTHGGAQPRGPWFRGHAAGRYTLALFRLDSDAQCFAEGAVLFAHAEDEEVLHLFGRGEVAGQRRFG